MTRSLLPTHLVTRLDFAIRLARQCGELALKEAAQLQISAKGAHDVLTQADLAVEQLIRAEVAQAFAGDLVVGEEMGGQDAVGAAGNFWLVDPIDGTTLTAMGKGNALSVIAVSEKGTMFDPGPCMYMEKIAVGPDVKGCIDINASYTDNLKWIAKAKGENVRDLTVMILERDRHKALIEEVRATGARIKLISDGDIFGAIATAWPDAGVDVLFGIGGTPEGVTSAAALKCMGGEIQGKLWPRNDQERKAALDAGYDLNQVLTTDDLVRGDNCFFAATGVTDGELLKGVRFHAGGAITQSLVMRSHSGTVRMIEARHQLDKLAQISSIDYA